MKRKLITLCLSTIVMLQASSLLLNAIELDSTLTQGISFRSIGPAFTSGRIADFAINEEKPHEYFVAVASGNIWKTTNAGINWTPVFDSYGVYSIGCLAMDPNNPNVVWAGTGENNSQRALGYGDGVYKTLDGGKSWKNMGLKESRQIGKILIDPRDTDVVYVAAEGSVWGPGGDRGLYKTSDGGKTWKAILSISENTGVSDMAFDPCNPDVIYASSHQRRRHTFTKINGGPESTIYKTTDGGLNWRKINSGLPTTHMGSIGLAVSSVNPNFVYAIIEAADDKSGFFRSSNKGESWEKMSDYCASSPQYYNEIFCDPADEDKVYSMDTYARVTVDGGKTFKKLSTKNRHVDDHALWINPNHTEHILIGGDGGIYESFDNGENWNFKRNLPVTQFYRVNVDNDYPFYNVYGGTQDNNSIFGPSGNTTSKGVTNDEWAVALGGDGFWIGLDSDDPNIVYAEYQYGNAYRFNKQTGELFGIKPQEAENEPTYKWNWDAPFLVSTHNTKKLYIGANKVFMSEDQGNSWKSISDDLTSKTDRNSFKVMGKYWSADAVAKDVSTSQFGTIVAMAESPVQEGLLFVGTDDGLLQITENNGESWTKIESFPGLPEYTYVTDVLPSAYDANVVYATFNNHKNDDFLPYVYISSDKGKSWKSLSNNLPKNGPVNSIIQDHVDKDILFIGTEFGVFLSMNNGSSWEQLKAGIPTICVKDLVIQKRENDLVVATFGRGMYILENYSYLRELKAIDESAQSKIFSIKDALEYIPTNMRSKRGDDEYYASNPTYGAQFTYFLKETTKTSKEARQEKEGKLFEDGAKIPVLNWDAQRTERIEEVPYLLFIIKDEEGNVIRKITSKPEKGINRINWDLKFPDWTIDDKFEKFDPFKKMENGLYAMPGKYNLSLALSKNGRYEMLEENIPFTVKIIDETLESKIQSKAFRTEIHALSIAVTETSNKLKKAKLDVEKLKQKHLLSQVFLPEVKTEIIELWKVADQLDLRLNGYQLKASPEEVPPHKKSVMDRLSFLVWGIIETNMAPSENHLQTMELIKSAHTGIKAELETIEKKVKEIEGKLM